MSLQGTSRTEGQRSSYVPPKAEEKKAEPAPVQLNVGKGATPALKAQGHSSDSTFEAASTTQAGKKSWVDQAAETATGVLRSSYEDAKALQQMGGPLKVIGDLSVGTRDAVSALGDTVRTAEQFYASSDKGLVKHVGGTLTAIGKGALSPVLVTDHKQSAEEFKENTTNALIEVGTLGLGKGYTALARSPAGNLLQGTAVKLTGAVLDTPVAKGMAQALESPLGREVLEKGGKLVGDFGSGLQRLNHAPEELLKRMGGQKVLDAERAVRGTLSNINHLGRPPKGGVEVAPRAGEPDAPSTTARKEPFANGPTGPEPLMKTPAPEAVMEARVRLKNLAPSEKLSSEDVRLLLEDTVDATRKGLLNSGEEMGVPRNQLFTPENIAGYCEMSEGMSWHHLKKLGLPESSLHSNQAQELFGKYRHAFMVADMPDGKRYLLDPTGRQFYPADPNSKLAGPGAFMRSNPESARIAHELLEKGYVELTEDVARFYAQSFGGPSEASGKEMLDLLASSQRKMNYSPILFSGMMPEVPPLAQ